jgi:hypothetical protein
MDVRGQVDLLERSVFLAAAYYGGVVAAVDVQQNLLLG